MTDGQMVQELESPKRKLNVAYVWTHLILKFGTSIVSTAYGAYLDHAYAQNLAKPPFTRICRGFEN